MLSGQMVFYVLCFLTIFCASLWCYLYWRDKHSLSPVQAQAKAYCIATQAWRIYEVKLLSTGIELELRWWPDAKQYQENILFSRAHPDFDKLRQLVALDRVHLTYNSILAPGIDPAIYSNYLRLA